MKNTLLAIWNFYLEGFRSMTLGRTLWLIILVKLFVMFFILKFFFFSDFLRKRKNTNSCQVFFCRQFT